MSIDKQIANSLRKIKMNDFPEKVVLTEDGKKTPVYYHGARSTKDMLAVITHYIQDLENTTEDIQDEAVDYLYDYVVGYHGIKNIPMDMLREPQMVDMFANLIDVPFPAPKDPEFTFIDLFAGIGGFRQAMQAHGGKCVFSSEWNTYSQKTYYANYGDMPFGDITKEETKAYIPAKFDVLCAGFPCQPFSIAGVSKKRSMGLETGFKDKTQGTLFFDVAQIVEIHRPKAFFLENVKNLVSHDKGNTYKVIKSTLEELGYTVYAKVMDGQAFVPQHRERIMIVGFDKERYNGNEKFAFPDLGEPIHKIKDILDPRPSEKYTLSDKLWSYLQLHAARHKSKGNGFGFGMTNLNGVSRTLSARYYKDGSEVLIPQGKDKNPRRLTPRECARLMGYPDEFKIVVSDTQAYRQFGNSVVMPLIREVAKELIKTMNQYKKPYIQE